MEYTINALAKLAGISTRTLRYYDQVALLAPCRINSSGYRIYGPKEVDALQEILFYKEMGFSLAEIKTAMSAPGYDKVDALKRHLAALQAEQAQLNLLMNNVEKTILREEGKTIMKDKEKFAGLKKGLIQENEKKFGDEVRAKYGSKALEEGNAKMMGLTEAEYKTMQELAADILSRLKNAVTTNQSPTSEQGLAVAKAHREWLSYTWPSYTKEAHAGLAQMYVDDERFTKYYDSEVQGCAAFLRDAVHAYVNAN